MVAPHCHTTKEVKAAIERVEHNKGEAGEGAPTGIMGGSASNETTLTPGVTGGGGKGHDWISNRGGITQAGK